MAKCQNMKCETSYAGFSLANLANRSGGRGESIVEQPKTSCRIPKKYQKFFIAWAATKRFIKDFRMISLMSKFFVKNFVHFLGL